MDTRIVIKNARFSYCHVFEKDDNGKYSVSIIIPKADTEQVNAIRKAIQESAQNGGAKLGPNFKLDISKTLHDGDIEKLDDEAYKDAYYINARSNKRPSVVKRNNTGIGGKTISITDENEFYSGCYGLACVSFYAYNQQGNKGIACSLEHLAKVKDGEKLGGGPSAEATFGNMLDDIDASGMPADDIY